MNDTQDATRGLTDDALDQLVVTEFPYPVAVNYRRLLDTEGWQARTRRCFEVFEFGMRAVTLGVLSQYCFRDLGEVNEPVLDEELANSLARPSLGKWIHFLFLSLRAYGGRRDLFFMPELYDMYWDTSREPHKKRKRVRDPFDHLVELRNDIIHLRILPANEEEWQAVGQEAMADFRAVLRRFSFLREYDLIRIVGGAGDEYEYERYTGQAVTRHQGRLEGVDESLRANWFYLCRPDRTVLTLHPLLVFWFEELEQEGEKEQDAAVFSGLLTKAVEYMATVARENIRESDPELVARFWTMLEYLKDRISKPRERVGLSWSGLRQVSEELTAGRMGATRDKYRRDLYMQRLEILREFQEFLDSEKVCFVLTGKSGVGKSNFILSLADEYAEQKDVGFLMYNGARLEIPRTIVEMLSEDLSGYLDLGGIRPADLLAAIDRRVEMAQTKLVVVFDAINENADGKALLRQIDQLVGQVRYPWLKVIITSRPQAWRTLKRGLPLAENRYYCSGGSEDYWVQLEDFVIKMEPFPRENLAVVYEKYRQAFNLQTDYEDLNPSIREALRDPLILRLVAEIYKDQAIPKQIRQSHIYDQYLQKLLETGQLHEADLILLKQELVPLMISEGHYTNRVTASQVHDARTRDGRPLWELIRSDDLLASGERVNASYVRLVDYEILSEQGTATDYEITFKYERFYDYYGGFRLQALLEDRIDVKQRAGIYQDLIARIQDPDGDRGRPYLWGPVRRSLILDLEAGRDALIVELAQTIDQLTKELIVSVLTAYGEGERQSAGALCHQLLTLRPSTRWRRLLDRRVRLRAAQSTPGGIDERSRRATASDSQVHMAKKAAIEVGYGLHLQDVLEQAAYDNSAAVRAVAAQYIYYLWRDDQKKGFEILENISRQIPSRWIIPNAKALESCLGVTMMIIFWHYQDLDNRGQFFGRLQQIWKSPIEHILFLGQSERPVSKRVKGWVRDKLLQFVVRLAAALAGQAEEAEIMFSIEDLKAFFPADEERKQLFAKLAPHLDAVHAETDGLAAIEGDLIGLMQDRDLLSTYLAFAALISHLLAEPEPTLRLIQSLFEIGMEKPPPPVLEGASPAGPMVMILVWTPRNLLYGQRFTGSRSQQAGASEHGLEVMGTFIKRYEDRYGSRCSTTVKEYRFNELSFHSYFSYLATGNVRTELLDYILDKAIGENDVEALARHILDLAGIGSDPACGVPRAAVQAVRIVLQKLQNTDLKDRLQGVIIDALSNLRAYYPDIVDDLLAELDNDEMPPEIKRAIRARGATESLGTMLGIAGAWFARDTLVDPDPFMRNMLKWLLVEATSCKSFSEWLRVLVKQIINVAYGEPVF